ncbi:hypothetical protein ES703_56764 [subsurface metagenome]
MSKKEEGLCYRCKHLNPDQRSCEWNYTFMFQKSACKGFEEDITEG